MLYFRCRTSVCIICLCEKDLDAMAAYGRNRYRTGAKQV